MFSAGKTQIEALLTYDRHLPARSFSAFPTHWPSLDYDWSGTGSENQATRPARKSYQSTIAVKAGSFIVSCSALAAVWLGGGPKALAAAPAISGTYGQQVVAAVLMGEAWSEGEQGMLAVAEVIRIRADASGSSPLATVQQPYQFSCLNETEPRDLIRKFSCHPDFEGALRIARLMYNTPEALPGIAQGATHFERHGTRARWARGHQPVARFGRLNFYRLAF